MSQADDKQERRKRNSSSGALGRVLALAQSEGLVSPPQPSPAAGGVPPSHSPVTQRFFPGKGFARVPADACRPWGFADRPDEEFDHLEEVTSSFQTEGQIQPAVVRVVSDPRTPEIRYEVIAGQVRWRAAKRLGAELDVVVRELSDEAAFRLMVAENEFRRGLSDLARSRRLKRALEESVYKDKSSLATACGLSNSQLSYLLGFADLDPVILSKFKNPKSISARLGYALNAADKAGYRDFILRDAARIESGDIARDQIPHCWDAHKASADSSGSLDKLPPRVVTPPQKFRTPHGLVMFSVKATGESGAVIRFSKDISNALDSDFWRELGELVLRRVRDPEVAEKAVEKPE